MLALGDMVRVHGEDGELQDLPGVAPVAMQQGRYAAKLVKARLRGRDHEPFRYRDKGNLATIGRARAVADLHAARLSGFPAWVTWLVVHLWYLIGFQNRLLVLIRWSLQLLHPRPRRPRHRAVRVRRESPGRPHRLRPMAVILAFGSAAVFALGTVLQQRVVMDAPEAKEASAGILFRLIQHPVWLGGIAAYGIAFGMQAAALGDGRLVVVQPILATTIVFALPLGVWLSSQRITRRDVIAAIVVTVRPRAVPAARRSLRRQGGRADRPVGRSPARW